MLLREFFYSDVRSARFIESQEIGSFKESLPFSVRDDNADFQISSTYHTLDVSAGVQYQRDPLKSIAFQISARYGSFGQRCI
jgi:hypothetical protein